MRISPSAAKPHTRLKMRSLGQVVLFLLPSLKLKGKNKRSNKTFEQSLHEFLLRRFDGYTVTAGNIFGFWQAGSRAIYGEHKEYKVSFQGTKRTAELAAFLSQLGRKMGEDTIYFETGEDAWLIKCKSP